MQGTMLEGPAQAPDAHQAAVDGAAERMMSVIPSMFRQVMHEMRGAFPDECGDMGETQFRIIHVLSHREFTMGELAEKMKLRGPTITRTIDALVTRGYVDRRADAADRRKIWLTLTPSGRASAASMEALYLRTVARLLQPLPTEQLDLLVAAFTVLQTLLDSQPPRENKTHIREVQH